MPRQQLAAVFVALTLAGPTWASAEGPLPPKEDLDLAHDILRELVDINTTHEHGSTEIATIIQRQLVSAGFAADDVMLVTPADKPIKGNVVVRYRAKARGAKALAPILFLGHLDVVEAKREDWSTDPFQLTEQDGWFYGRGSLDMKDGDAALLETLIRLKREHFVPARDLIVAFTADEEAGGDANGPAFLLKEHRDLIEAGMAINLDGGGGSLKNGERLFYGIGTSEKVYVTFTVETTSPGGHGSLPGPDNAIYRLADGLGRLEKFKQQAKLASGQERDDRLAVARTPPDLEAAERLSQTVRLNAQLRTTCVATLISGGHAQNALPQRAKATIQCRMMPGDTAENVQATLVRVLDDPKLTLTLDAPPVLSPESAPTPQILDKAGKVVHSMWPGVPIIPSMASGFSDGRQTRTAGIPTYDLSGMWADVDDNRAHGRDERIGVRQFDESVEYTYRLMKSFGGR
jgi:acetylornithine deacetylase/succinyl-diaminopimelate desuccinylase-like protein